MFNYYLVYDDGNMLIRHKKGELLEKYDVKTQKWLLDDRLLAIYYGGIPVKVLSEEEAKKWML